MIAKILISCLIILVLWFVIHAIRYNYASYRVLYVNGVYKSQKSQTKSGWGDTWTEWEDIKTHENEKEAIEHITQLQKASRMVKKDDKVKVVKYFF